MWKTGTHSVALLRRFVTALCLCSMVGLVLTVAFSFEEPNAALLFGSSVLLLTAVVSVFAHVALTRTLSRSQKRLWLQLLTGRRAVSAWTEYLSSDDLSAAATRVAQNRPARR
jgi:hypothetical protein